MEIYFDSDEGCIGASLRDQTGRSIAMFKDARDAEYVLNLFVENKQLEEQISDLKIDLEQALP